MKKYPKYKESNILWVGQMPAHWGTKRLASLFTNDVATNSDFAYKHAFKFNYGTLIPKNELGDEEEYRETYVKYTVLKKGDVVLNGLNLNYDFVSQRVAMAPSDGIITSSYIAVRPRETTFADYYLYVLKTMDNRKMFHGMGTGIRLTLSFDELKRQMLPFPPLDEQKKIVEFIDRKSRHIESYITERERELNLLAELKQAMIADVVTHGLNSAVARKDSSIPWVGMIPEHWETKKLSQIMYEHYISNKDVHHQNLLSLSYGNIVRKDINTTEGLLPASFDDYQIVEEGNIILRLTDLQNDHKSLRVGLVREEGIITSAYVCLGIMNEEKVLPAYMYYLLHTYDIMKLFYSMGGGIRQGLNWKGLKKLDVVVPPIDEQRRIVEFIEEKTRQINHVSESIKSEILYLKEYKPRMIADAVTGAIYVQ